MCIYIYIYIIISYATGLSHCHAAAGPAAEGRRSARHEVEDNNRMFNHYLKKRKKKKNKKRKKEKRKTITNNNDMNNNNNNNNSLLLLQTLPFVAKGETESDQDQALERFVNLEGTKGVPRNGGRK